MNWEAERKRFAQKIAEYDEFFRPIAPAIEGFAKQHNLLIEKYNHSQPFWQVLFKHPKGGVGQIEIRKHTDDAVIVCPSWSICDYDSLTQFLHYPNGQVCSLEQTVLMAEFERTFWDLVLWDKAVLEPVPHTYHEWEKPGREKFLQSFEQYPIPKLD